ncbi:transposase [Rhodococcus sp. 06-418-1B]|nr:transposase [Rhodococcus sp. 06-418-1B]OZC83405.1 transposase [Rhodococcus sp. 06-418-1B]
MRADDHREHRRAAFDAETRAWALTEYEKSRQNYASRAECVAVLARTIGAHENTVTRWVKDKFGSSRSPASDDVAAKLRAAEAEIGRLRSENRSLTERLAACSPRSLTTQSYSAHSLGAAAL